MIIIGILLGIISYVYGETIDRTTADVGDVSCQSFPCVINCLEARSCYTITISCPSTGAGNCTINFGGDSPAESSIIDAGSSTNVLLNVNEGSYEALFKSKINAGNINDLVITVNSGIRALYSAEININSMGGDLQFNVNGDSYHAFYDGKLNVGSIHGNLQLTENTANVHSANFKLMVLSVNGDIDGNALFESQTDNKAQSFDAAKISIYGAISGNLQFTSKSYGSFSENSIEVTGDIGGDLSLVDTSSGGYGFYNTRAKLNGSINGSVLLKDASTNGHAFAANDEELIIKGNIGGNFEVLDQSHNGAAGQSSVFRVYGNIGGNVSIRDESGSTSSGYSFYLSEWYLACPNDDCTTANTISGDVEFYEDSPRGWSFSYAKHYLGRIGGNFRILDYSAHGGSAARSSTFNVNGNIGGDFRILDKSYTGACGHSSVFRVNGNIGGDVSVRDESRGPASGYSFYNAEWYLSYPIAGDVEFYEHSPRGYSFNLGKHYLGRIGGNFQVLDNSTQGGSAAKGAVFNVNGNIGGDFRILDKSYTGAGGQSAVFRVNGSIGGYVSVRDESRGPASGYSFHRAQWDLPYPISGDVEFYGQSPRGDSFSYSTYNLGSIGGSLLFQTKTDTNHQGFDHSTINIESVIGGLQFKCNSQHSFSENAIKVSGDIGGDLVLVDTSKGGYGFHNSKIIFDGNVNGNVSLRDASVGGHAFYGTLVDIIIKGNIGGNFEVLDQSYNGAAGHSAVFRVNGNIGGYVSVRDESRSAASGYSFYLSEWYLACPDDDCTTANTISGDVEFYEESPRGWSFSYAQYYLGRIGGNFRILDHSAHGGSAARSSTFNVNGNIGGEFRILDKSYTGACGHSSVFRVNGNIGGDVSVRDESRGASSGYSFYKAEWYLSYPIAGDVEFYEHSPRGYSFNLGEHYLGRIGGNFEVLDYSSQGGNAARGAVFNVNGNIGGYFKVLDKSYTGGTGHSAVFRVNGSIGGYVSIRDESMGPVSGYSFQSAEWHLPYPITGDVEFVETSLRGWSFSNAKHYLGNIGGKFQVLDYSHGGYGAYSAVFNVNGNIGGIFEVLDKSAIGATGQSAEFLVTGSIAGNVSVRDESWAAASAGSGYSFHKTKWNLLNSIAGDVEFIGRSPRGYSFSAAQHNLGNIGGNFEVLDYSSHGGNAARGAVFNLNRNIGGNFRVLDNSYAGGTGHSAVFRVNGSIGGYVSVRDESTGPASGYSFQSAEWHFLNTIGGDVEFVETSKRGWSFSNAKHYLGNIGGNFDVLDYSTGGYAAKSAVFNVNGNIGGDFRVLDKSVTGATGQSAEFVVTGIIGGDVSVRDESRAAKAAGSGYSFHKTKWNLLNSIVGNVEFIEESARGVSFSNAEHNLGNIGGNLLFQSKIDNGGQAFDASIFNIASVAGDLSFLSNTYGSFSEGKITIDTVTGTCRFIGTASAGFDFYSANIDITECANVIIETNGQYAFGNSDTYFGNGVGFIDITINSGNNALYSTLFDAQEANEIQLTCNGTSDCGDLEIKCPEDNRANKCSVSCSSTANCNNIDLFTTNGYCVDASFNCLHDTNDCPSNTLSQVFCTVDSPTTPYGTRSGYCAMQNDNNQQGYYCNDIGAAKCSTEKICEGQTPTPTESPTFEPCTEYTDAYNVQFIIDESGSVKKNNYRKSIDFVIGLVRNDINPISKVSALSFGAENDDIYKFTDNQNDERAAIIDALTDEKDDYDSAHWTGTYNGLKRGIELFNQDNTIVDNKILILITDGIPTCGDNTDCRANVCGSGMAGELSTNGIRVYIVGVGKFDASKLNCLVNDVNKDIQLIKDFTSTEFKRIEEQFRTILCPGQQQEISAANIHANLENIEVPNKNKYNKNNNNNNHRNDNKFYLSVQWLITNAFISVIVTFFIILSCSGCCYYVYHISNENQKYSKVAVVNDNNQSEI